jgi:DDE superfamily endonuclease
MRVSLIQHGERRRFVMSAPIPLRRESPRDQRTASTYIFRAVCPKEGKGAALILPTCNTVAMNLHLVEIAATDAPGAHAVLLVDQAGWHLSTGLVVPPNITIIALPPKCPELNPVENVWQFLCRTASSNLTTISSTTAVWRGISSSISPGESCPSDCANGRTGSDQWDSILLAPSASARLLTESFHPAFRCLARAIHFQP